MPIENLESEPAVITRDPRVICTNSLAHSRIISLSTLGLSSQDIETITGINKVEF